MAYLAPIHRPSSIRHALTLNLLDPNEECLVVAKANRIEIWTHSDNRLVRALSKPFCGRISMLAKIRPIGYLIDHLFIGTLHFKYFTVAWNAVTQDLEIVQSFEDQSNRDIQELQSRDGCLVDPTGQYILLELFEGVINLIKIIKPRKVKEDYMDRAQQIRITELKVRASAFLYTETKQPKIAFLYTQGKSSEVQLVTYRIVDDKGEYLSFDPRKNRENELGVVDITASHLIPVPKSDGGQKRYIVRNSTVVKAHLGGVIIVGEVMLTYLDDESRAVIQHNLEEVTIFVAWEKLDNLDYLLADEYGRLFALTILVDGPEVIGMKTRNLGKATKASKMVHLGNGVVFIASHEGDSQVVSINLDPNEDAITLVQTMPNIAPILDFAVMDMGSRDGETHSNEYSSGQARLVMGSGANECGSLRSVRSGVGLEDVGILADMKNISAVFSLESMKDSRTHDTVLVSLPIESRIFRFNSKGEVEEVEEFRGLILKESTLLAMNLPNALILQVTPSSVILLRPDPAFIAAEWRPPEGQRITAASANHRHVLLSSNGVTLVTLDVNQGLRVLTVQNLTQGEQVACINVPSQLQGVGVVGFWQSGSISILGLPDLTTIQSEDLKREEEASVPRDVALVQILPRNISGPTLFVAMENGIVLTFNVHKSSYHLSGKKSVVLGTRQARFHILPRKDGLNNIFASCEHPSLIYASEGRLIYSAVTADSASSVCLFDSEAFPDSIIVATDEVLKISQIDTEKRTHVRTLPMGLTVRRIAYSPTERAFGLGCIKRELKNCEETMTCSFVLVEDVLFSQVGKAYSLDRCDEIIECVVRAELPTAYGESIPAERFIVGTSFLDPTEGDERGRLLILGIDSDRNPYLISSLILKGSCRQVAILNGRIVAALLKTVVIFHYHEITHASAKLTKVATYRCLTCPIDLIVHENTIAVADLQKSLVLLEYAAGADGMPDQLIEVARHYQACWATAVAYIDDDSYLESDQEGNLLVLRRNADGVSREDRHRMKVTSEFHLGEMVNRIRKIDVESNANAMIIPKAFLATTEGSIYLFFTIAPSAQDLLMRLQTALAHHLAPSSSPSSPSDTEFDSEFFAFRAYQSPQRRAREPFRFVDAELLERFLLLDDASQVRVCRTLSPGVESVRSIVEDLRRLH